MKRILSSILLCASGFVGGCATPGPYAEVTGELITRADFNEEPVIVLAVDGVQDVRGSRRARVEPGQRLVLLATARRDTGVGARKKDATVPLNAKPCLRYHFAARHESMTLVEPWQLVLKSVEPIPECVAKFPGAAPLPGGG